MRKTGLILVTSFLVMILTLTGALPQKTEVCEAYAEEADETTKYTVFIYSGKEGTFGDGSTVKKIENLAYKSSVTVSLADLNLQVKNPDQYYVRGLKVAGHDNDELSSVKFQSYNFEIKEDMSFSVSYGMAGGMVRYDVKYQDENGGSLHPDESFYGMVGDKPVVAYRHVEGYLPDSYNLAKTLSSNESQNVFTFTYHRVYDESGSADGTASQTTGNESSPAALTTNPEGNNRTTGAGGSAAAGYGTGYETGNGSTGSTASGNNTAASTTTGQDNKKIGADITDLDDDKTPLADRKDQDTPEKQALSGLKKTIIGIIAAGLLTALILLYLLLRHREDYENDE